jgi:conjugative transfer signal peptidase TraF
MSKLKWLIPIVGIVLLVLSFLKIFYFNIYTHSLPQGIYLKSNSKPQVGSYAATCLNSEIAQYGIQRGYLSPGNCKSGTVPVLKIIKGIPGDDFSIKNSLLNLNGVTYQILNKDSSGRPIHSFYKGSSGRLMPGQYILLSNFVENSWDSRYWGPVTIEFVLKPFLLFEKEKNDS